MEMYPPIHPYATEMLDVSGGHRLYLEQSGNPDGLPVVFLHGGPGSGTSAKHRSFFDPEKYRIVLFDQRGAGQSTPHADLKENTTQNLLRDLETIRVHLAIDRWLVFGGSWGSTLALAYAQAEPGRVLGLILRGIFLCRSSDINWLYQQGASRLFPEYWEDFLAPVPESQCDSMVAAYHELLTGDDEVARMRAAEAWCLWEGRVSTLLPDQQLAASYAEPFAALAMARIENHYFVNQGFLEENQLLVNAHKIQHIPCTIVHGRYDVVCPMEQAWALHKALPESKLMVVENAGHSAFEEGNMKALMEATHHFAELLG